MTQEENQETRESPALGAQDEVEFSREDVGSAGEPPEGSPAAAQARAESVDESPFERPEVQILGAFVGAFLLAKVLQWLFGRD